MEYGIQTTWGDLWNNGRGSEVYSRKMFTRLTSGNRVQRLHPWREPMYRTVYRTLSASVGLYIVLFLGALPPAAGQDVPEVQDLAELQDRIVGVWLLNRDRSDNPQGRLAPEERGEGGQPAGRGGRPGGGMGRPGGGGGFGGRGGGSGSRGGAQSRPDREQMARMQAAMQDLLSAPNRMTVVQDGSDVLFTYDDGRVMRLIPDGEKHAGIAGNGIQVERRARWDGDLLIAEIQVPSGVKIVQTYDAPFEVGQLIVTTTLEGGRLPKERTLRRVYDTQDN